MKLSKEWVEHLPDMGECTRKNGILKAEKDCECGVGQRHRHCKGCGGIVSIGDWEDPGIPIMTFKLREI